MKDNPFQYSKSVILLPLFFVLVLWFVFWLQIKFDFDFDLHGIFPRTLSGLQGVFLSPFIHADLSHLFNNSIPLLVLLAALRFFYSKQSMSVIGYGILLSGILTWLIGRSSFHIGASGLIYVLVSFIFFKGIQTKYYRLVALSLTVVSLYGGMIWYVFPTPTTSFEARISWEGHLSGFITGFVLSLFYKTKEYQKVAKYDWEHPDFDPSKDKFMQRFDENGNFVNLPKEECEKESTSYFYSSLPIDYSIVENKKQDSKPEY